MLFCSVFGIVFVLVLIAIAAVHFMVVTTEPGELSLGKAVLIAAAIALLVALLVEGAFAGIAGLVS